jgi:hypothetical protein
VRNLTRDLSYPVEHRLSKREVDVLLVGGLLNYQRSLLAGK